MHTAIKWALLLVLFAPMFYFALRRKKWYLYLVCGFVGIFPDHFAIEFSASLPLLTGTRIMLLILLGFWLYQWFKEKPKSWPVPVALLIYGGVHLVIAIFNFHYGFLNEMKGLFILILERILLAVMIRDMVRERQELNDCLDTLILASVALAVIGIVQTIFNCDIASVLNLVTPRTSQAIPNRMGMMRAYGTSNAIAFGCHCAFVSVLTYFRLERSGRQRYNLALAILLTALICTFSRSSWLALVGAIGVLFITRPKQLALRSWPALVMTLLLCFSLFFFNANFKAALTQTGYSTMKTALKLVNIELPEPSYKPDETVVFEDPTLPSDSEEDTSESSDPSETTEPTVEIQPPSFGKNQNTAISSRLIEWTAVDYMMQQGHGAFGYGYNAFGRGKMYYYYPTWQCWAKARALDVGLLRITMDSGLVGLTAYLGLAVYLMVNAIHNRGKKGVFTFSKLAIYLIPLYLVLNFAAAYAGCFWSIIGLMLAAWNLDKNGIRDDEPIPPYSLRRF